MQDILPWLTDGDEIREAAAVGRRLLERYGDDWWEAQVVRKVDTNALPPPPPSRTPPASPKAGCGLSNTKRRIASGSRKRCNQQRGVARTNDESVAGEDDELTASGRGGATAPNTAKSRSSAKSSDQCRGPRDNGGGAQNKGKHKRARGIAEVGPVEVVDGYEKVMLEDGGFKKRRVGAKRWARHCIHGRQRSHCKQCGGASICEHGRQRNKCKECGGASICEHGRIRSQCKECGGASICEHGRQRNTCKECGGASICEHGRQRSTCKECGGASICEHGRRRGRCKECRGAPICVPPQPHGSEPYL